MRNEASTTAALVAIWRGWGQKLPPEARLIDDPYGTLFGGLGARAVLRLPRVLTFPVWPLALHMQVRTRAIDDALRAFLADGGRQVLILGAGYDCRAARFATELGDAAVFEVDHPATQARKLQVLTSAAIPTGRVVYLPWDFERRPVGELPSAMAERGHDPSVPTLTIWEGVTMYLHEPAIEATVGAVRELSAPSSSFVFTYVDQASIERPGPARRFVAMGVAWAGEPFRFGWAPTEVPAWCSARGFTVEWDRDIRELGRALLPARFARAVRVEGHRIAALRRT